MKHKIYPCCDNSDCPYCFGSGIVSGPEFDRFYRQLDKVLQKDHTMSRATLGNDRYKFAFGVDHTPMGTFFQIWDRTVPIVESEEEETDTPHFAYDCIFGPQKRTGYDPTNNPALSKLIAQLEITWKLCTERGLGTNLSVQHIVDFGRALQLDPKKVQRKAHELWD